MQRWHQYLGWVLCAPLILWALTGAVFIIKPGYGDAYEQLRLATPTRTTHAPITLTPLPNWQEARLINTVIGPRLLITTPSAQQHLNIQQHNQVPTIGDAKALMASAIAHNTKRYGQIEEITLGDNINISANTTTGITLTLNWHTLSVRQKGPDRRLIETLYKLHYLQYTPYPLFNKIIAVIGLCILLGLTALGLCMSMRGKK